MAIERAPFGSTGHHSSRVVFGAVALAGATPAESEATLALVLEHGINHIDTASSYGDSEDQLRPWLAEHRDRFFLATKTGERTAAGARESIHRSLERMGVTGVDLIQLHNLVHPGEWEQALGPGGALEAAIEARAEGLVRFIGVTGHGLTVAHQHIRALGRFPFDSVLAPVQPDASCATRSMGPTSPSSSACAASAASPCRRSRRSREGPGDRPTARPAPGTSR